MSDKDDFRILTARDHCRLRPGMYIGSTSLEKVERFVNGQWQEIEYVPALLKMIDEIIDNSLDEAIRTNFKHANNISVRMNLAGQVLISDNGRGIPQDKVEDANSGEMLPRPVAAWTRTNAGTSFQDDRVTIGANGVGSACTNYMSAKFTGTTRNGKKEITVECANGAEGVQYSTRVCKLPSGTDVRFTPDFDLFGCNEFTPEIKELVKDRLYSLQMSFPEIAFHFDGKRVGQPKIKKYSEMYSEHTVHHSSDNLSFFFASSPDGWRPNCFVNGVHAREGGAYTDVISSEVADHLTKLIKRRHKIDVSKQQIKQGLTLVMFARNFQNAKYDSQTKERITNTWGECKTHAGPIKWDAIARKIADTPEIIEPIIEAQLAKKLAAEKRAATLAQKKATKKKVAKHVKATKKGGTCFITEGDSAIGFLLNVRDKERHGGFPLRGVIRNTWGLSQAEILKNKELAELVSVLDLDLMRPESVDDMWYDKIAILVDADNDGIGHISPLLLAFFYRWPRLFTNRRVGIVRTPILIATKGKTTKWFYTFEEANEFKHSGKSAGWYLRYIKGLGSLTEKEYSEIINNPVIDTVSIDDAAHFETMFGEEVQLRKDLLRA